MNFARRLTFYLGGFAIGLIFLFFFLGGKRASCDYGPNARTLKNIRSKELVYSQTALEQLYALQIDTTAVGAAFESGDVIFSESNTRLDSCKIYMIQHQLNDKKVRIEVENCEEIATVISLMDLP